MLKSLNSELVTFSIIDGEKIKNSYGDRVVFYSMIQAEKTSFKYIIGQYSDVEESFKKSNKLGACQNECSFFLYHA